jgi:hypothetical protein
VLPLIVPHEAGGEVLRVNAVKQALFWGGIVGGFLLGMFSPLLIARDLRWLYVIIPVMLVYVLWLMRMYQLWGRSRRL